jgi:hypothetical protein
MTVVVAVIEVAAVVMVAEIIVAATMAVVVATTMVVVQLHQPLARGGAALPSRPSTTPVLAPSTRG